MMKRLALLGLLLITVETTYANPSGKKPTPPKPPAARKDAKKDIHASPLSVMQAHFKGYKNKDKKLILQSMAPETRLKIGKDMENMDFDKASESLKRRWGVTLAELDVSKITVVVEEDDGDTKEVDTRYNGKSINDSATVIKIDGKWYIKWF